MERMAWTDDRIDDLSRRVDAGFSRMDAGFARVDVDIRELRSEMASFRVTAIRLTGAWMATAVVVVATILARGG